MPVHDEERTIVVRRGAPGGFAPGTVLGHTYVVEALLARGGMVRFTGPSISSSVPSMP